MCVQMQKGEAADSPWHPKPDQQGPMSSMGPLSIDVTARDACDRVLSRQVWATLWYIQIWPLAVRQTEEANKALQVEVQVLISCFDSE